MRLWLWLNLRLWWLSLIAVILWLGSNDLRRTNSNLLTIIIILTNLRNYALLCTTNLLCRCILCLANIYRWLDISLSLGLTHLLRIIILFVVISVLIIISYTSIIFFADKWLQPVVSLLSLLLSHFPISISILIANLYIFPSLLVFS